MLLCADRGEMFEKGEGDIAIDGLDVSWKGRCTAASVVVSLNLGVGAAVSSPWGRD
jgi:hypothetical protein